ncbi:MAG: glycosyltransferase [Leptospirales bacterium]|nr:glycosyltransferase [Leptospirales bacterium]
MLPATLAAISKAMAGVSLAGELLVVDNASTDSTAQIGRGHGAHVVTETVRQISRVRNAGAAASRGEFLIFVDADTLISPELLRLALEKLKDGACGGGSLIRFEKEASGFAALTARFWKWISLRFKLLAGCFIFVRRDAFVSIGGFSEKVYASEEIWFGKTLKTWARKESRPFVMLDGFPPVTSSRKLDLFPVYKLIGYTLLFLLFPFAVRFRVLCTFWYDRPGKAP